MRHMYAIENEKILEIRVNLGATEARKIMLEILLILDFLRLPVWRHYIGEFPL